MGNMSVNASIKGEGLDPVDPIDPLLDPTMGNMSVNEYPYFIRIKQNYVQETNMWKFQFISFLGVITNGAWLGLTNSA